MKKIELMYPDADVKIVDETPLHVTHREMAHIDNPEETHLRITVASNAFINMSVLEANRSIVNSILAEEYSSGLHAATLQTIPKPSEDKSEEEALKDSYN